MVIFPAGILLMRPSGFMEYCNVMLRCLEGTIDPHKLVAVDGNAQLAGNTRSKPSHARLLPVLAGAAV
jgi:hypothetical protein